MMPTVYRGVFTTLIGLWLMSTAWSGVLLKNASTSVQRNIASPMQAPNVAITPTSPRFRLTSTVKHHVKVAVSSFKLVFQCVNVSGVPANCPAAYTINKIQVYQTPGGSNALVTWNGGNARTIPVGAVDEGTDWINFPLSVGPVYFNMDVTVPSAGYVSGKFYLTSVLEGGSPEVSWACDPAACTNDVATGSPLTIPSGGVSAFPIRPSLILGLVPASTVSISGGVTSLSNGTADLTTSDGSIGGGMLRRGAWQGGWPIATWATDGQNYTNMAGTIGTNVRRVFNQYTSVLWLDGPSNDVFAGSSLSSIRTNLTNNYWTPARASGMKVIQANVLQRVAAGSADFYTTVGSQSLSGVTGYDVGGVADQFNAGLSADVGVNITAMADVRSVLSAPSDNHFWAAAPETTTLTASALSSATTFQTATTLSLVSCPIFDPQNAAGQRAGALRQIYLQSGSPPSITNTLFNTITVTQNNGNTVVKTNSQDGTHPCGNAYTPLGAVYRNVTPSLP